MKVSSYQDNVDLIEWDDRRLYLVGTAHISKASADLAEKIIREITPDAVAVELCGSRFQALRDPNRWKNLDLYTVIRSGKSYVLLSQLILSAFQKRLGNQLNVQPGAEMMRAITVAEDIKAEIILADREVKTTLKRVWSKLSFRTMNQVLAAMATGLFGEHKISEEEVEKLKNSQTLDTLMEEFTKEFPEIREPLITERDKYLAAKMRDTSYKTIVGIVGAGHVPGIKQHITETINVSELEIIPPPSVWKKLILWGIPALVIIIMSILIYRGGVEASGKLLSSWILVTAASALIGTVASLAHPLTILSAIVVAPLRPFVRTGWVAGLVEALVRKPRVSDLESATDDLSKISGWWKNRVGRIFLVLILTNLASLIGMFIALKVASS